MAPFGQQKHYDYVIVGGGVAGLVLAARLSENPDKNVLVVEAGANRLDDENINVPGLMGKLWGNPGYDWDFWTEPQTHVNNRVIPQPRGKVLGGSSAINFMAIVYPTREDFAAWTALGNRGWSAAEMAQYYRKFHTFYHAPSETRRQLSLDSYMDELSQGTEGPLCVTIRESSSPLNCAWLETIENLGFHDKNDPIAGEKRGAFTPPSSIDPNGNTRSYAASAYYNAKVASRENLEVMTETYVENVILEKREGSIVAEGVTVQFKDGSHGQIFADEVILSAGALKSPQILELSGIGAKEVLTNQGIPVIVENPGVGENLQDHAFAAVSFEVADGLVTGDVMRDPQIVAALLKQYQDTRTGPFGGTPMSAAYLPAVDGNGPIPAHDVEHLVDSHLGSSPSHEGTPEPCKLGREAQYALQRLQILNPKESTCQFTMMSTQMHYHPGRTTMADALAKTDARNMISILVCLNHPLSRGTVHIQNHDPSAAPRIDPSYLSHPLDLEILSRGIQFLDRVVETEPLSSLLKSTSRLPNIAEFSDLDVAKQVVRDRLFTTFHPASTCSMMPQDLGGVVDDRMRVYGVRNLRVVDASIFPMMTQGNIQATVYAVAEKAADIIKEDWQWAQI